MSKFWSIISLCAATALAVIADVGDMASLGSKVPPFYVRYDYSTNTFTYQGTVSVTPGYISFVYNDEGTNKCIKRDVAGFSGLDASSMSEIWLRINTSGTNISSYPITIVSTNTAPTYAPHMINFRLAMVGPTNGINPPLIRRDWEGGDLLITLPTTNTPAIVDDLSINKTIVTQELQIYNWEDTGSYITVLYPHEAEGIGNFHFVARASDSTLRYLYLGTWLTDLLSDIDTNISDTVSSEVAAATNALISQFTGTNSPVNVYHGAVPPGSRGVSLKDMPDTAGANSDHDARYWERGHSSGESQDFDTSGTVYAGAFISDGYIWATTRCDASDGYFIGGTRVVTNRLPAISNCDTNTGTVIDVEARLKINEVLQAMRKHGLIAE